MQLVQEITVYIPNVPSSIAVLGDKLRAADVNISAIMCVDAGSKNKVHLIVSDVETAKIVLREIGTVETKSIIEVTMKNKPGAVASIGRACAASGLNIHNLYATSSGKESMVYIDCDNPEKALESLKQWKNHTLS